MASRLQALKPRLQPARATVPTIQPGSWRTDAQSSTQRGYGYKWQQARAGYLAKHPLCVYCLRDPAYAAIRELAPSAAILMCSELGLLVPAATVVDHIDPHRGDWALFWDKTRWQSLCATHHSSDKQREEAAAGFR